MYQQRHDIRRDAQGDPVRLRCRLSKWPVADAACGGQEGFNRLVEPRKRQSRFSVSVERTRADAASRKLTATGDFIGKPVQRIRCVDIKVLKVRHPPDLRR